MTRVALLILALLFATALFRPFEPAGTARAAFPGGNGKIAFVTTRDGNPEIYTMNSDASAQTNLTNHPAHDQHPAWSADGDRIVFDSDRSGNRDIFVMNADGLGLVQLTEDPADEIFPSLSPDGARVAFISDRSGNYRVYVMNLDGTGLNEITDHGPGGLHFGPVWSPDGNRLILPDIPPGMYTTDPEGQNEDFVAVAAWDPDWSPEGEAILYSRQGGATGQQIAETTAEGVMSGLERLLTTSSDNWTLAVSPDGRQVVFCHFTEHPESQLYVMNRDGTEQTPLGAATQQNCDPAWQPLVAGNVDCNPGVTSIDALLVLQRSAGLLQTLPCEQYADVNANGEIDSIDAALILQYNARLLKAL